MSKHRIYIEGPIEIGRLMTIQGEQARYIRRVLRLRKDDALTLFDGTNGEFPAIIKAPGKDVVEVEVGPRIDRSVESPFSITLLQGISRGDRMDHVVQKATEIGVSKIVPVLTDYSVVKLDEKRAAKRVQHWRAVAVGACEQSGRNRIPHIESPAELVSLLGHCRESGTPRIILKPGAPSTLKSTGGVNLDITVLIGPEGGFSDNEYELAEAAGFLPVGFGPRILRTETAAIAVLAALQTLHGDFS